MSSRRTLNGRRAFTLLEMILALMITSMTVMVLYRFVSTHLTTVSASTAIESDREALDTLVRFVQAQMNALDPYDQSAIKGQALKFHGMSADELTWQCPAGPGVLTTAASGDFQVTLVVQPVSERASETELGLRRQPIAGNKASFNLNHGGAGGKYDWLPLIRPMAGMEVRYFDQATHSWTDAWTAVGRRPQVVRLRLWRHADQTPVEAVLEVPSARLTPQ